MWTLYGSLVMSDLDIRLRYFLCCDLESSLRKLLPDVSVRPFGSSVNSFGRYDCDLDLVIDLDSSVRRLCISLLLSVCFATRVWVMNTLLLDLKARFCHF